MILILVASLIGLITNIIFYQMFSCATSWILTMIAINIAGYMLIKKRVRWALWFMSQVEDSYIDLFEFIMGNRLDKSETFKRK